jgi:5-methylcytosine-specific restriction endonuclease McrA
LASNRPDLNKSRWQSIRRQVRLRDGNACVVCGSRERLSVHHLVKARDGGRDALDNLVTLCATHHRQADVRREPRLGSDEKPTYEDDPERGIFWGPPDDQGKPRRWSKAWFEWRNE